MITYAFLQQYWWFLIALLGAILVFLLFVQGANSMIFSLGRTEQERKLIINSTGRKWELTFTTLVTFGGAFFASFPLFYSTSFGGAYWLWVLILLSFVIQAVGYEFQNKLGNLLGTTTFRWFLVINGLFGPLLIGCAVATFFNGSEFLIDKSNLTDSLQPVISRWANAGHGLDALLDPWNLVLGFAVFFLARVLGHLYIINNVEDENLRCRSSVQLIGATVPFLILFVAFLVRTLLKDGYAYQFFIYAGCKAQGPRLRHRERHREHGAHEVLPQSYGDVATGRFVAHWFGLSFIWHHPYHCQQNLYPGHLAHGCRCYPGGFGLAVAGRMESHGLLSLECRFAEQSDH